MLLIFFIILPSVLTCEPKSPTSLEQKNGFSFQTASSNIISTVCKPGDSDCGKIQNRQSAELVELEKQRKRCDACKQSYRCSKLKKCESCEKVCKDEELFLGDINTDCPDNIDNFDIYYTLGEFGPGVQIDEIAYLLDLSDKEKYEKIIIVGKTKGKKDKMKCKSILIDSTESFKNLKDGKELNSLSIQFQNTEDNMEMAENQLLNKTISINSKEEVGKTLNLIDNNIQQEKSRGTDDAIFELTDLLDSITKAEPKEMKESIVSQKRLKEKKPSKSKHPKPTELNNSNSNEDDSLENDSESEEDVKIEIKKPQKKPPQETKIEDSPTLPSLPDQAEVVIQDNDKNEVLPVQPVESSLDSEKIPLPKPEASINMDAGGNEEIVKETLSTVHNPNSQNGRYKHFHLPTRRPNRVRPHKAPTRHRVSSAHLEESPINQVSQEILEENSKEPLVSSGTHQTSITSSYENPVSSIENISKSKTISTSSQQEKRNNLKESSASNEDISETKTILKSQKQEEENESRLEKVEPVIEKPLNEIKKLEKQKSLGSILKEQNKKGKETPGTSEMFKSVNELIQAVQDVSDKISQQHDDASDFLQEEQRDLEKLQKSFVTTSKPELVKQYRKFQRLPTLKNNLNKLKEKISTSDVEEQEELPTIGQKITENVENKEKKLKIPIRLNTNELFPKKSDDTEEKLILRSEKVEKTPLQSKNSLGTLSEEEQQTTIENPLEIETVESPSEVIKSSRVKTDSDIPQKRRRPLASKIKQDPLATMSSESVSKVPSLEKAGAKEILLSSREPNRLGGNKINHSSENESSKALDASQNELRRSKEKTLELDSISALSESADEVTTTQRKSQTKIDSQESKVIVGDIQKEEISPESLQSSKTVQESNSITSDEKEDVKIVTIPKKKTKLLKSQTPKLQVSFKNPKSSLENKTPIVSSTNEDVSSQNLKIVNKKQPTKTSQTKVSLKQAYNEESSEEDEVPNESSRASQAIPSLENVLKARHMDSLIKEIENLPPIIYDKALKFSNALSKLETPVSSPTRLSQSSPSKKISKSKTETNQRSRTEKQPVSSPDGEETKEVFNNINEKLASISSETSASRKSQEKDSITSAANEHKSLSSSKKIEEDEYESAENRKEKPENILKESEIKIEEINQEDNSKSDEQVGSQFQVSKSKENIFKNFGRIIPNIQDYPVKVDELGKSVLFLGNDINLPLSAKKEEDGSYKLSLDVEKLCDCKETSCNKKHTPEVEEERRRARGTNHTTTVDNTISDKFSAFTGFLEQLKKISKKPGVGHGESEVVDSEFQKTLNLYRAKRSTKIAIPFPEVFKKLNSDNIYKKRSVLHLNAAPKNVKNKKNLKQDNLKYSSKLKAKNPSLLNKHSKIKHNHKSR